MNIHSCRTREGDDPEDKHYMVIYFNNRPTLTVHSSIADVAGNGTNFIEYNSTEDRLRIYLEADTGTAVDLADYEQGRSITLAGDENFSGDLNGRSFVISKSVTEAGY